MANLSLAASSMWNAQCGILNMQPLCTLLAASGMDIIRTCVLLSRTCMLAHQKASLPSAAGMWTCLCKLAASQTSGPLIVSDTCEFFSTILRSSRVATTRSLASPALVSTTQFVRQGAPYVRYCSWDSSEQKQRAQWDGTIVGTSAW